MSLCNMKTLTQFYATYFSSVSIGLGWDEHTVLHWVSLTKSKRIQSLIFVNSYLNELLNNAVNGFGAKKSVRYYRYYVVAAR